MQKAIEPEGKIIKCEHRDFNFSPHDKFVSERPINSTLYHECGTLAVYQGKGELTRYFHKIGEVGQPEAKGEPDTFLAGLVGAEEPEVQEFNEKAMGQGDGTDEIPF